MPNYHFETKIISRGKGNSFVRTANYISGVSLRDSYLGKTYYRKRNDVLHKDIMLPVRAPPEFHDLQTLCDKVEAAERRCDAQTAREFICSLPNELPDHELIRIVTEFCSSNFVDYGLGIILAVHKGENKSNPFENNPHVHILVTMDSVYTSLTNMV